MRTTSLDEKRYDCVDTFPLSFAADPYSSIIPNSLLIFDNDRRRSITDVYYGLDALVLFPFIDV